MLKTHVGANDGIIVKEYIKGYVYNLSDELADCFLKMGVAVQEKDNVKPTGKGKPIDDADIARKQMQAFKNKDAAAQLKNKAEEKEGDKQ